VLSYLIFEPINTITINMVFFKLPAILIFFSFVGLGIPFLFGEPIGLLYVIYGKKSMFYWAILAVILKVFVFLTILISGSKYV
jgi:hypothetical protein